MSKYSDLKIIKLLREYNNKFGLLTESKKDILINKLGLTPETAQVFDDIGNKLSIWLANKYIKYLYDFAEKDMNIKTHKEKLDFALLNLNTYNRYQLNNVLSSIMDYVTIGLNGNKSSLDELNLIQIYDKSKEWYENLNLGDAKINYKEKNPIILDFRDENGKGFYWVDLQTNTSPEECERMGHCGRTSYGNLYSLRSDKFLHGGKFKINRSHLTAAIGENNGMIYQLKGKNNSKPKKEYHKYILPLLDLQTGDDYFIKGFGSEIDTSKDFKLSDLPDTTIKKLYQKRPELFNTIGLQKKLMNLGLIDSILEDYILEIPYDKLKNYIEDDTDTFERVYKFSDILNGNYDVIEPYNVEPYDLISKINSENISKIEAILNDWISHEGNYDDYNLDLISKIEKYDNEEIIINDIVRAYTETEIDEYFSDLYDSIINALDQYGEIISIDDGIVKINVDFQKLLELNPYSEYWMIEEIIEECKNDIYCVFQKLRNSDFEFPKLNLDYRWELPEPDEDNFNDRLNELL